MQKVYRFSDPVDMSDMVSGVLVIVPLSGKTRIHHLGPIKKSEPWIDAAANGKTDPAAGKNPFPPQEDIYDAKSDDRLSAVGETCTCIGNNAADISRSFSEMIANVKFNLKSPMDHFIAGEYFEFHKKTGIPARRVAKRFGLALRQLNTPELRKKAIEAFMALPRIAGETIEATLDAAIARSGFFVVRDVDEAFGKAMDRNKDKLVGMIQQEIINGRAGKILRRQ